MALKWPKVTKANTEGEESRTSEALIVESYATLTKHIRFRGTYTGRPLPPLLVLWRDLPSLNRYSCISKDTHPLLDHCSHILPVPPMDVEARPNPEVFLKPNCVMFISTFASWSRVPSSSVFGILSHLDCIKVILLFQRIKSSVGLSWVHQWCRAYQEHFARHTLRQMGCLYQKWFAKPCECKKGLRSKSVLCAEGDLGLCLNSTWN